MQIYVVNTVPQNMALNCTKYTNLKYSISNQNKVNW